MPGTRCDLHNIHFAYSWHQVWYILRIYVPNLHITSLIVCVFGAGGGGGGGRLGPLWQLHVALWFSTLKLATNRLGSSNKGQRP